MAMKNPYEVLLAKEAELTRIKEEVHSLHIAICLLREEGDPELPKDDEEMHSSKPCSIISGIPDDPELEGPLDPHAQAGASRIGIVFFKGRAGRRERAFYAGEPPRQPSDPNAA
jgi:hypothetical protein